MSPLGHSRRFDDVRAMSGLPPIATEMRTSLEVRFVPLPDSCNAANSIAIRSPRRSSKGATAIGSGQASLRS